MARRTFTFLVLGLLAAIPAVAQKASPGQVAYVDGLRAFDGGEYVTAAARMKTALAEDPLEATARFRHRAQNAEDYFPHFWLGLSLEKLGDRDGARSALQESRRQGVVQARPTLERILTAALVRLTPPTPPPTALPTPAPLPIPVAPLPEPTTFRVAPATPASGVPRVPSRIVARSSPVDAAAPVSSASSSAALRSGLRTFFRGDYARAELLLAPEAGRNPMARAFLAWSLGGRYLLSEPRDRELLSRARTEFATALLAGGPTTGEPWVSPAILALFGAEKSAP